MKLLLHSAERLPMKIQSPVNNAIRVAPVVYLHLALLLLILPIQYIVGFLISGLIHEMGHFIALKIMKVPIYQFRVTVSGAVIETGEITALQELLCAIAGPFAGMMTCMMGSIFPLLAVCAFVQTAYNLIPLYPLDGGRICKSIMTIRREKKNSLQR